MARESIISSPYCKAKCLEVAPYTHPYFVRFLLMHPHTVATILGLVALSYKQNAAFRPVIECFSEPF